MGSYNGMTTESTHDHGPEVTGRGAEGVRGVNGWANSLQYGMHGVWCVV